MLNLPPIGDGEDKSSPFRNCIRKNYRHVRKWAKRTLTNCFRVYDREMHHYPLAIDFYDGRFSVHYFAKGHDQEEPPAELVAETEQALGAIFGELPIFWRTRARSKTTRQYEKRGTRQAFFPVLEYGVKFWVNLTDYLDSGLFLDHREMRQLVASEACGKRLLNLFAYTCSFSVHAALRGAITTSVDLSNTYTEWGRANFLLNGLSLDNHRFVRTDCLKFLEKEKQLYDLIVVDPPTISRSKKMEQLFDIQRDYYFLLSKTLQLLAPGGTLFFSSNARKFALDASLFPNIREITAKTHPIDFHDKKIHRCWIIYK